MGKVGLRSKSELVQYHAVRTHRQIAERQKLLGLVSSYEKLCTVRRTNQTSARRFLNVF
jgi:hypothetical protein